VRFIKKVGMHFTQPTTRCSCQISRTIAVVDKLTKKGFTISNQDWSKRGKIIIAHKDGRSFNIRVHSKKKNDWPNCKGVSGSNSFLALVDYQGIRLNDEPFFYILSEKDWIAAIYALVGDRIKKGTVEITEENVPVCLDQPLKDRKKIYTGMSLKNRDVVLHKEKWNKFATG
jgi:hypothetical protein